MKLLGYNIDITKILTTVGVAGGAYLIYRSYKNRKLANEIKNKVNSEEEIALMQSNQRTIDDYGAETIADALYDFMKGYGTDEDDIYNVLIIRNKLTSADLIAINKAFGYREYGSYGSPMFGDGDALNLVQWLREELDSDSDLYILLQTKFQQAGINFD